MDNKEYLNEEKYQKNKKKINLIANILLIIGIPMVIYGFVMAFGYHKMGTFIFAVLGMTCAGFGLQAKLIGNAREVSAFMAQQQIPIAKESAEKLAPTAGKVAKEITKGVKEGIEDENKDE